MWTPEGCGSVPGDEARLVESPDLEHLGRAIVGGGGLRAGDLMRRPLEFCAPPDPTGLLRRTQADNPPRPVDGVPLRLLTWNLALLDVHVLGRVYKQSPYLAARRGPLFARLLGAGADIALIQELWQPRDIAALAALAPAAGYRLFSPPRPWRDGLAILLREGLWTGEVDCALVPYDQQSRQEALSFPGKEPILRSFLRASFRHPRLGPVTLFNTHLQAFPHAWRNRILQSRRLAEEVGRRSSDELVLVGGDLNAGPFYARQSWRCPDGRFETSWWHNALSLPLLLHHGGLVDLVVRGRRPAEVDRELRLARLLDNDPVASLRPPSPPSAEHLQAFTATDHNRLYHAQYAGTEQVARLDHLLARDPSRRVHVVSSTNRFADREVTTPDGPVELSDHYAVEVELLVG